MTRDDGAGEAARSPTGGSSEFLTGVFEAVAFPIFVKDRAFRFVLVNEALCALVGRTRAEVIGHTDFDLFEAREAEFFRRKDAEMFATGSDVVIDEEPITDAAGVHHVLATTKVPLRDVEGAPSHLVGIIHDITRLKAAEEELRLAKEGLEARVAERTRALEVAQAGLVRQERLAVLGKLAGGLAHQIRSPLATIRNAAFIIKHQVGVVAPDSDLARALAILDAEVVRANDFIADLLDYARVREPELAAIAVRDLVDATLAQLPLPPSITVSVDVPDLPSLLIDAGQVKGALFNLVRNAYEAMPEGGALSIDARRDGDAVVVSIGDTGAGVSDEVRERLFEPLVTTKQTGLGLGLVTAKTLIDNQGGSIACLPGLVGAGAHFEVRLPIVLAAPAAPC